MAIVNTAAFAQVPKTGVATVTAADDLTDAPANTVLIVTADALDGAIVTKITAIPRATITASRLDLFISKDSGTTKKFLDSETMAAFTVVATAEVPETVFANITETAPIRLEAGDELYVGSGVALAGGIQFTAEWTDF